MLANFSNILILAGLVWRRERIRLPIWIIAIIGISIGVALAFPELYPPGPKRDILAQNFNNPAITSMLGPGYGIDNYHIGAIMGHQMLLFTALTVAIMNILLAISHTRLDEENGRIEVIRSLPVGKLANAGATLLVLTLANLSLATLMACGLGLLGLEGMDWAGSCLYGATLGVTGIFFATATVLIAQLTETSRMCMGLSFGFLVISYLLRSIGDVSREALSLISPLGIVLRTQVYVNNYWWPIIAMIIASVVLTLFAFKLNTIRDLEAGFITTKPGRTRASRFLQTPLGLALRLQKSTIIGWVIGIFILGTSYGVVLGDFEAFFQASDILKLILPSTEGFSLAEQYVATLLAVLAMTGTIPVLLTALKLKSEEEGNLTEHLLARSVPRWKVMGRYLLIATILAIVMQVMAVLGLWSASASVMDEPFNLARILQGGLAYVPVMWIMLGITAILIGFIPRFANLIWLYLGYTFFVIYFGKLLQVPEWLSKLTPFGYIPNVPLEKTSPFLNVILMFTATGMILLGLMGYQKRDIQG